MPTSTTPADDSNSATKAEPKVKKPRKTKSAKAAESADQPAKSAAPAPVTDVLAANAAHVAVGSKAEAMRDKLRAEPKVRVLIPLANGEKAGVTQSVILNGYSFYVRKGEYVEVPQSVADVLDVKMKHKIAVDNHPLRADAEGGVKMDKFGS